MHIKFIFYHNAQASLTSHLVNNQSAYPLHMPSVIVQSVICSSFLYFIYIVIKHHLFCLFACLF